MTCNNNVVECLRNKGIWPDATTSSIYNNDERFIPNKAINYSKSLDIFKLLIKMMRNGGVLL